MQLEHRIFSVFNREPRMNKLITEEVKATKLFLWLFYIIFIAYEIFYFYVFPSKSGGVVGLHPEGMGIWLHVIVITLLPFAIFLLKGKNPHIVKYFIFFAYNIVDFINSMMMYIGKDNDFASGNVVELFFILFASLYLNKKYFWLVYITIASKYIFFDLVLQITNGMLGVVILTVLAGISYLFLSRFNSYINTLEKINEDLRQKEKLALVGQLATSVAHEIKNPLASLKGFTQLQNEKYPVDAEYYKIMISEIDRINLIVDDLLHMGKPKSTDLKINSIKDIIDFVVKMSAQFASNANVSIINKVDEKIEVLCDQNQLKQVFINLIKNAVESMQNGGNIRIYVQESKDKQLIIIIEDEGSGIEEEKIAMLGQPFFTTKTDGNGLGLMVTQNIIEKHNGKILYISELGKGTRVEVYLPMT